MQVRANYLLTYMSPLPILIARQQLIELEVDLDGATASRDICAFPHVVRWIENDLPQHEPMLSEGLQDLLEQLDFLLLEYIRGADVAHWKTAHIMTPHEPGIYELKSPDLRLFGWFYKECSFIVANIDTAERCKRFDLYHGYQNDTVRRRDQLNLDEPKFIVGDIRDVLCT